MKIVVATRCLNEEDNIIRFMKSYDFADEILVSDGGSTDGSLEILSTYPKVTVVHFGVTETIEGETWNPDNPHANFAINAAKGMNPDWLIWDDMDCTPTYLLQKNARQIFESCGRNQVNAYRMYLWGETQWFPEMNKYFHPTMKSLWAWKPRELYIHADENQRHGTYIGISSEYFGVEPPMALLHRSWSEETIQARIERYDTLGIRMNHPFRFAGPLENLPDWARNEE